jgi:hypothetical protein
VRDDAAQAEKARLERTPLVRRQQLPPPQQQRSAWLSEEDATAGNLFSA